MQPFSASYTPHVNTHPRHVVVSDRVRLCRTRSLSIPLQTLLPIKWRHVKGARGKRLNKTMLTAEVRQVMNGRICSHCAKHTHFSHRVSNSFTFHPHTSTHAKKRRQQRQHCTTPAFLIFPPSALPDSPWNLEVTGVRRAAGFRREEEEREGGVTGCNLRESLRASDCASTCRR